MIDPDALAGVPFPEQQTQLRGHDAALAAIGDQLASGKLPGAMLLYGPHGIGKATLAFQLARTILNATGDESEHRVVEQLAAGSHPNVFVLRRGMNKAGIKPATVITIDQVARRDGGGDALRDRLHQTRGRAGHRIAIIDSIDDCNPSATNALLKILEEPPPETLFLLVSHRMGQLLPTIRSRCHRVALRPISDDAVRQVVTAQRPALVGADLDRAVALAGGRPRRAFETLALADDASLGALQAWLQAPMTAPTAVHLKLADSFGADPGSPEMSFARRMIGDFIAAEVRDAAIAGTRMRLASANALWDKAQGLFADTDSINLDMKQTLVAIFDAIRKHLQTLAPAPTEPS